jgi:DNA-directed RNA polymerase specialized sigma24 family protein
VFDKDMSDERKKKENELKGHKDINELENTLGEGDEDNPAIIALRSKHFAQLGKYDFESDEELIDYLLSKVSELCQKLLRLHYLLRKPYQEIEEDYGIPNAKSQAGNCRKRLRDLLNNGN